MENLFCRTLPSTGFIPSVEGLIIAYDLPGNEKAKIIQHPGYNSNTKQNDIAVIVVIIT